jgi:16S rRNA G966 N2-methylase RsmD
VFLDPPYRQAAGLGRALSESLAALLGSGGRIVGESDRRAPLDLALPIVDERRYGDTLIRIHEHFPETAGG